MLGWLGPKSQAYLTSHCSHSWKYFLVRWNNSYATSWNIKYLQEYKDFIVVIHRLKILIHCIHRCHLEHKMWNPSWWSWWWEGFFYLAHTVMRNSQSYASFNIFPFLLPSFPHLHPIPPTQHRTLDLIKKTKIIKMHLATLHPKSLYFQ